VQSADILLYYYGMDVVAVNGQAVERI